MRFELTHQNAAGVKATSSREISYLQLVKHLTFAGIDKAFFFALPARYMANFFEFSQHYNFFRGRIYPLNILAADPTERNYISNRLGRAMADHLSKSIYLARYTHSYECAMAIAGFQITGTRPDFYCDTGVQQFAVEAKGLSVPSVSDAQMAEHKIQSTSGPLPVNFSVASVAYGLYRRPKVKYYDPIQEGLEYQRTLNLSLRSNYYAAVLTFVSESGLFDREPTREGRQQRFRSRQLMNGTDILIDDEVFRSAWNDSAWSYDRDEEIGEAKFMDRDGIGVMQARQG